jgi:hypothetical protein
MKLRHAILPFLVAMHHVTMATPPWSEFMGINGHTVQFRPELYAPVANRVRDYHPVEWDLGKESDSIPPFPSARNGVNWQSVYGSWKKRDWTIDACLMFESIPRERWKNLGADSRAYAERFARAFGPSSAMPLVESVEIGNEPGKFSDADYRTIFENMARGFRVGDPKIKVVTCALTTGPSGDYSKSVSCIAGLEDLYDVLNVHTYPQLEPWPTWRRSFPEDLRLKSFVGDVTNLCRWRDDHAPGKPVWITEFGYDSTTKKPNPNSEFKKWIGVTDEQQAQWIVRSWLLFASLPVDRAYLYFFNDTDQPQVHGSSGLTRNFEPKPAYYAVAHLHQTLANYRFKTNVRAGEATVAQFENIGDSHRQIWVIWLPVGEAKTARVTLPPFNGKIEKCERMPLTKGQEIVSDFTGPEVTVSDSPSYLFLKE